MNKLIITLFALCAWQFGFSQLDVIVRNPGDDGHIPKQVEFESGKRPAFSDAEDISRTVFGFSDDISLELIQEFEDKLGFTHYRFQQLLNGVPLETAHVNFHVREGQVERITGHAILNGAGIKTTASIQPERAIDLAVAEIGVENYAWEDEGMEKGIKAILDDPNASYYPQPSLIYITPEGATEQYILAYKMAIATAEPFNETVVYVDAKTGNILRTYDAHQNCTTPATGESVYSGNVDLDTDLLGDNKYRLYSCKHIGHFHTRDLQGKAKFNLDDNLNGIDITNTGVFWAAVDHPTDQSGIDVHWGMTESYEFLEGYGFDSYGNGGENVKSFVNFGDEFKNAFYATELEIFCFGAGTDNADPWVGLDIVGHEFWHAVTQKTAGLVYSGESGALNESMSDIFGTAIEERGQLALDWLVADEIGSGPLRDMSNPNSYEQPDCYNGAWYIPGGPVHTNSGVANHWFYLLTTGGYGINDCGESYFVDQIGLNRALEITFRALTVYFTPGETFEEARLHTQQAAEDLYGPCSREYIATVNAWHAVCVGVEFAGFEPPTNVKADLVTPCSAVFNWDDVGADFYQWRVIEVATSNEIGNGWTLPGVLFELLQPNTEYALSVRSWCDGHGTPWSNDHVFTTPGHCQYVTGYMLDDVTTCSATISWSNTSGSGYIVRYRECNTTVWTTVNTPTNAITLDNLDPGTCYEIEAATDCVCMTSPVFNSLTFETEACPGSQILNTFAAACEITVLFSHVPDATYRLEWRVLGTTEWASREGTFTWPYTIEAIETDPVKPYEIRLITVCKGVNCTYEAINSTAVFTPIYAFTCEPPASVDMGLMDGLETTIALQINPSPNATRHRIRYRTAPSEPFGEIRYLEHNVTGIYPEDC